MIQLAEMLTRLTAQVLRAGVVTPLNLTNGASVAELTVEPGTTWRPASHEQRALWRLPGSRSRLWPPSSLADRKHAALHSVTSPGRRVMPRTSEN